jgi:indolepyruvate ferredoxin oxidoreductase alpha subunit
MKKLLTGNEAIAQGAHEAGVRFAAAYPGTPSTEIMENIASFKDDIIAEWSPNEKVALETVIGASIAGARSLASMKHVGVNVAADPLFTFAYTGVTAGTVIITADEPGMHSSQNEQDNRHYARHAKLPLLEPSNSQEAKDMVVKAFDISEKYDFPVLIRMTTRVCHSKSIVEIKSRKNVPLIPYKKNIKKYTPLPAHSRLLRIKLEENMDKLKEYSNNCDFNYYEWNNTKIGIIASGITYEYAKEVFQDNASYLKIGFSYPLPTEMIKKFSEKVNKIYVLEENDSIMETEIKALGISCIGKEIFPNIGELTPDKIREACFGNQLEKHKINKDKVIPRPPALCSGCPHRGIFYDLSNRKDVMIFSDIGCYTLGLLPPLKATDALICMGASISGGHGVQKVFEINEDEKKKVVSIIGDSTFFHTGLNSLLNVAYNKGNTLTIILDNRITGMTGHQENPGSGYTLQGDTEADIDIEKIVKAFGINNVKTINPNDLTLVKNTIDWGLSQNEPTVIITRWPCVLKRFSKEDIAEFNPLFSNKCIIDTDKCIGCKKCLKVGCPSISYDKIDKKAYIDPFMCVGCTVCMQVCPVEAIKLEVK